MKAELCRFGALFVLGLAGVGTAWAGPVDLYGFGARTMGRGSGGVALQGDVEGIFINPAGLTGLSQGSMSIGYSALRADLFDLPDVYWDTNQDGAIDDTDTPLSLSSDYGNADGFGFVIGRPVGERFGMAVAGFVPTGNLLNITTFEPALPTYFMYESRAQRFQLTLGFGWEQLPGVSVGGAVEVLARAKYDLQATIGAGFGGADEGDAALGDLVNDLEVDVHRMGLQLKPAVIPVVSLLWEVGEVVPELQGLQLGASYRGSSGIPVDVDLGIQGDIEVGDLGDIGPLTMSIVLPVEVAFMVHHQPEQLALGAAWQTDHSVTNDSRKWSVYGDLRRTRWDKLQLNVARIVSAELQSQLLELSEAQLQDANTYTVAFAPTWSSRVGGELEAPTWDLGEGLGVLHVAGRLGWGMEPSPLVSQGTGTALLDSDRMLVSGGIGFRHNDPFGFIQGPVRWDAFGSLHFLASGALDLGANPEYRAGAPVDGAPVLIGGHLWAAGAQWSFDY